MAKTAKKTAKKTADTAPAHHPLPGDAVATWIRAHRDEYVQDDIVEHSAGSWEALNDLLVQYEAAAAAGIELPAGPNS